MRTCKKREFGTPVEDCLMCIIRYNIFIFNVLQKLNYNSFDVKTVRAIRDIMFMVLIPQIIFLFIIFSRALGFNIKSFDFKKDLEEMQIDKSDYEEVEVTLGNNNYKFARFFRKNGDNVIYVSGSDCHGTPITVRANKLGVSGQEIADLLHENFGEKAEPLYPRISVYVKTLVNYGF